MTNPLLSPKMAFILQKQKELLIKPIDMTHEDFQKIDDLMSDEN